MNHPRRFSRTLSIATATGCLVASCLATATPARAASGSHHLMTRLTPSGATPSAWGKAKYTFVRAASYLTVETHGLLPGPYDIRIGGGVVGTLDVTAEDAARETTSHDAVSR